MKRKTTFLYIGLFMGLVITGVVVYKILSTTRQATPIVQEDPVESIPVADSAIVVAATKSRVKDNTVVLKVSNLSTKYLSVGYELTYESQGLIKGVNSGSKPIDVGGKDFFEREVYLGTCSRNVCKPDLGVTKVSVALEFVDIDSKKSQFSKDFEL